MLPPGYRETPALVASDSVISRWMRRVTDLTLNRSFLVCFLILAMVLPVSLGIFRLSYESNYVYMFRPYTRIVRDYQFVENRLDGIGQISLVVPTSGTLDAEVMQKLAAATTKIENLGAGRVVKVLSVATAMDPEKRWASRPADEQNRIYANKLQLVQASPQAAALGQFWNSADKATRFIVRVPESSPNSIKQATFDEALSIVRSEFGSTAELTGLSLLMTQVARSVIDTQWTTFCISSISIFLMMLAAFRRFSLALLAMLPTLLSVGLVLGLMGWLDFKLDLGTALVASVALGLSVDDTFHCLLQYHQLHGRPYRERLYESYKVTGPGVLLSSFAVSIGFLALATSEFVPFSRFGIMVAIATAGSSIGNLLLLPACLSLRAKWRFRQRNERQATSA
jgi:predicted RND superfamily exporter protein